MRELSLRLKIGVAIGVIVAILSIPCSIQVFILGSKSPLLLSVSVIGGALILVAGADFV